MTIKKGLFEGRESEGYLMSLPTLFVAGDVPVDDVLRKLRDGRYEQVYFGAGGLTFVRQATVERLLLEDVRVTAEVSSVAPWMVGLLVRHDNFHLIVTMSRLVDFAEFANSVDYVIGTRGSTPSRLHVQIKVDTGAFVLVFRLSDGYLTNMASAYKDDKVLMEMK